MSPSFTTEETGRPVFDGDSEATYTLDILARLSGVSSEIILAYHERGLLQSVSMALPQPSFDDGSMRRLRRLESVRAVGEMNMTGLCLVAQLLDEVEQLREELRARS